MVPTAWYLGYVRCAFHKYLVPIMLATAHRLSTVDGLILPILGRYPLSQLIYCPSEARAPSILPSRPFFPPPVSQTEDLTQSEDLICYNSEPVLHT